MFDFSFFITVSCKNRNLDQLTQSITSEGLLESFQFRHERGDWFAHLVLLMPDHLHALLHFPESGKGINATVSNWKRFAARSFNISWQSGFFEHRIRNEREFAEKHEYIRENPVRAGLVSCPEEWPHQWKP